MDDRRARAFNASFWSRLPPELVQAVFRDAVVVDLAAGRLIEDETRAGNVGLVLDGLFRLYVRGMLAPISQQDLRRASAFRVSVARTPTSVANPRSSRAFLLGPIRIGAVPRAFTAPQSPSRVAAAADPRVGAPRGGEYAEA